MPDLLRRPGVSRATFLKRRGKSAGATGRTPLLWRTYWRPLPHFYSAPNFRTAPRTDEVPHRKNFSVNTLESGAEGGTRTFCRSCSGPVALRLSVPTEVSEF
jgi:hypothetical protein